MRRSVGPLRTVVGRALVTLGVMSVVGVPGPGSADRADAGTPLSSRSAAAASSVVQSWLTTPDGRHLLAAQAVERVRPLRTAPPAGSVVIRPGRTLQTFIGAGASITESSAGLLIGLPAATRTAAMRSLFDRTHGAGISLLRQPIGSSDFALSRYTYDDVPAGRTDPGLTRFSVGHDETSGVLPLLREALALNPDLTVIAAPWSAPAWMKTSDSLVGGTLRSSAYRAYADYLVRFVTAYRAHGVPVSALSLQNEPGFSPPDYPGMTLTTAQQATLLGSFVGPAFRGAGLHTRLLVHDHNWDTAASAETVLTDPVAGGYAGGTAFHGYAGDPTAQDSVHADRPALPIYETECGGGTWSPHFRDNLWWDTHFLVVQGTRHWSSTVVTWNIALDPQGGPTAAGGTTSRGVLTIDRSTHRVTRNVEYYVLAHLAGFVRPGARRIDSADPAGVETTAWRNQDGTFAVVAHATGGAWSGWIATPGAEFHASIPAGGVITYTW